MTTSLERPIDMTQQEYDRIAELVAEKLAYTHKEILSLEETSKYLGVSKNGLYKLTSQKRIPFYRQEGARSIYFDRHEVEEWARGHYVPKPKPAIPEKEMKAEKVDREKVFLETFGPKSRWANYKFLIDNAILKIAGENLTPREINIIRDVLFDGIPIKELTEKYSLTTERIRQIFIKTLRKIIHYAGKEMTYKRQTEAILCSAKLLEAENKKLKSQIVALSTRVSVDVSIFPDYSRPIDDIGVFLCTPIRNFPFSVRCYNCLHAANINFLFQLVTLSRGQIMQYRNFGKKTLNEIVLFMERNGLCFGMDISKHFAALINPSTTTANGTPVE